MPFKGLKTLQKFPWTFPASLHGLGEIIKASPCIPYVQGLLEQQEKRTREHESFSSQIPPIFKKKIQGVEIKGKAFKINRTKTSGALSLKA